MSKLKFKHLRDSLGQIQTILSGEERPLLRHENRPYFQLFRLFFAHFFHFFSTFFSTEPSMRTFILSFYPRNRDICHGCETPGMNLLTTPLFVSCDAIFFYLSIFFLSSNVAFSRLLQQASNGPAMGAESSKLSPKLNQLSLIFNPNS